MNKIGHFELDEATGIYRGEIITLSVQADAVSIVPNAGEDCASAYWVMVGHAQIGAGVLSIAADGRKYLDLRIDDPSFAAPISARLERDAGSSDFVLRWQRESRDQN